MTLSGLNPQQAQVIVASVLGNGGIYKVGGSNSLIYREKQPRAFIDYLQWKRNFLLELNMKVIGNDGPPVLQGFNHEVFRTLRCVFYNDAGYKTVIPPIANDLDELGFFVLYLNIGKSMGPHHAGIRIRYSCREAIQNLVNNLNNSLGLSLYVSKDYKGYSVNKSGFRKIVINRSNLQKLRPIWLDLCDTLSLPPCCRSKIPKVANSVVGCTKPRVITRKCMVCGEEKPLSDTNFPRKPLGVTYVGFDYTCTVCEGTKKDFVNHREKMINMLSKFSDKNNSELSKILGLSRERIRQLRVKFRMKNPKVDVTTRKEDKDLLSVRRKRFRTKKYNCKFKNVVFDLSFSDIDWPTHCPVLGIELDYFAEKRQDNSPSFDRIKPSLGYVVGNVIIISERANRIKNDGTYEEHKKILEYLDKYANVIVP